MYKFRSRQGMGTFTCTHIAEQTGEITKSETTLESIFHGMFLQNLFTEKYS